MVQCHKEQTLGRCLNCAFVLAEPDVPIAAGEFTVLFTRKVTKKLRPQRNEERGMKERHCIERRQKERRKQEEIVFSTIHTKQLIQKQISILHLIFHLLTAASVLCCSLKKGSYPQSLHVVFCSFGPLIYSDQYKLSPEKEIRLA